MNRIDGAFKTPQFPSFRVSLLGVVVKKMSGEFRLIHHLSFPSGASVNEGILSENTTATYCRVDDAISLIKRLGKCCFLSKTRIKNAFLTISISPRDYDLG